MSKGVKNQNSFTKSYTKCGEAKNMSRLFTRPKSWSFKCLKHSIWYARWMNAWERSLEGSPPQRAERYFCCLAPSEGLKHTLHKLESRDSVCTHFPRSPANSSCRCRKFRLWAHFPIQAELFRPFVTFSHGVLVYYCLSLSKMLGSILTLFLLTLMLSNLRNQWKKATASYHLNDSNYWIMMHDPGAIKYARHFQTIMTHLISLTTLWG